MTTIPLIYTHSFVVLRRHISAEAELDKLRAIQVDWVYYFMVANSKLELDLEKTYTFIPFLAYPFIYNRL